MNESIYPENFVRLRVCAWCGRFAVEGEWIPAEEAISRLNLDRTTLPSLTHGICPTCLAANPPPKRSAPKPSVWPTES